MPRAAQAEPEADDADQALRLADAGEPLVRQLLRHLSRAPTASRRTSACRSTPRGRRRSASSPSTSATEWSATSPQNEEVFGGQYRSGRMNGFVDGAARGDRPDRPDRDGLLRRRGHSLLLERRRRTTSCSTASSRRSRRERAQPDVLDDGHARQLQPASRSRRAASATCRRSSTGSQARGISWKFYVQNYDPEITFRSPGTERAQRPRSSGCRCSATPATWTTRTCGATSSTSNEYFEDLGTGHAARRLLHRRALGGSSEHPPGPRSGRPALRPKLINALMRSRALEELGLHVDVRRLGRLVRPRAAAAGRQLRLRVPRRRRCW